VKPSGNLMPQILPRKTKRHDFVSQILPRETKRHDLMIALKPSGMI
jgi:hypothetical protein